MSQLLRRRFTVEQYHQMVQAGILSEDDRVELIEGEIVEMSPIGRRHAAHVKRLNKLFSQRLGNRVLMGVQDPIQLSDFSEPQPDLALLKPHPDYYEAGHPQPQDIFLLVEVGDITIEFDREVKIPPYARSNITEVWLLDIPQQLIEVYRAPDSGHYQNVQRLRQGQTLSVLAFPQVNLSANEILG